MPAVIGYWQLEEDEEDFLAYLTTTGNIMAMPTYGVKTKVELAPRPIAQYVHEDNPHQLVFAMEHHARAAKIEEMEEGGEKYLTLAYMSPCVIMYRRGRMSDGNKLGRSNLAAYWNYPDKEARGLLAKDEDFVKWARKVFAWVRRHTPEQIKHNRYSYRATRRAKDAATRGVIEAVPF